MEDKINGDLNCDKRGITEKLNRAVVNSINAEKESIKKLTSHTECGVMERKTAPTKNFREKRLSHRNSKFNYKYDSVCSEIAERTKYNSSTKKVWC